MSTFLELTNELLRRINEVELTSTSFASARGIQATAKDCVLASINEIMAEEKEWSFNFKTGSQLLTQGSTQYTLPADLESADWESFRLEKDDALSINTTSLRLISKDKWYQFFRPQDEDQGSDGRSVPEFVFMSNQGADLGFGVTPSPDKAYTVLFDYYQINTDMSAYDDTTTIPTRWDFVIMAGALKHFNLMKDNLDQGNFWTQEFGKAISKMRGYLAPRKDDIIDRRVSFGGPFWKSAYQGFVVAR